MYRWAASCRIEPFGLPTLVDVLATLPALSVASTVTVFRPLPDSVIEHEPVDAKTRQMERPLSKNRSVRIPPTSAAVAWTVSFLPTLLTLKLSVGGVVSATEPLAGHGLVDPLVDASADLFPAVSNA